MATMSNINPSGFELSFDNNNIVSSAFLAYLYLKPLYQYFKRKEGLKSNHLLFYMKILPAPVIYIC